MKAPLEPPAPDSSFCLFPLGSDVFAGGAPLLAAAPPPPPPPPSPPPAAPRGQSSGCASKAEGHKRLCAGEGGSDCAATSTPSRRAMTAVMKSARK